MENAGVKSIGKHNIQRNTNPTEPKYTAEEDADVWYNRATIGKKKSIKKTMKYVGMKRKHLQEQSYI